MAWSLAMAWSTAARSSCSRRTSRCSVAASRARTRARSARSWTWRCASAHRSLALNDSGGARIQEGVESLAGYAEIFTRNVLASGVVPQLSVIMGPCAGGAVYSPAMTDFILMVDKTSYMFITGPDVVKAVTHEEVSKGRPGRRAHPHQQVGVAHLRCSDEKRWPCCASFCPSCRPITLKIRRWWPAAMRPIARDAALDTLVPIEPTRSYDIKDIIQKDRR